MNKTSTGFVRKTLTLLFGAVGVLAVSAATVDERAFAHRLVLTTSGYAGSSALANFPILVRLTSSTGAGGTTFDPADAGENGADLRFYLTDGTLLAHEIDEWHADGESVVWVKVPSMTAATEIRMGWGAKSGWTLPEALPATETWSSYYAVWHMNEPNDTDPMIDRTGRGHNLTIAEGKTATPTKKSYTVGNGRLLGGQFNGAGFSDLGSSFTLSGTLKSEASSWSGYMGVFRTKSAWNGTDQGFYMSFQNSPTAFAIFPPGSTARNFTCTSICTSPLYFCFSNSKTYNPHLGSVYFSGVRINGINDSITGHAGATVTAFQNVVDTQKVVADELRWRAVEAWGEWVKAEYDTQTSASFVTLSEAPNMIAQMPARAPWTGDPVFVKPDYVVNGNLEPLTEGTDYVLTYDGSTNAVGTATVTLTGIGAYASSGSQTFSYTVYNGYGAGKTLFAKADGAGDADCLSWATAGSLTNALSKITAGTAAQPTAVVLKKGTYVTPESKRNGGNFYALASANVTIRSEMGDPADVVIQGLGDGSYLRFLNVNTTGARLQGLTIEKFALTKSGGGDSGGAIYCGSGKSLTVTNCVFRENRCGKIGATNAGAAIYADGTVYAYDTLFTNNIAIGRAGAVSGGNVTAHRCQFVSNVCTNHGTHAQGAAAYQGYYYDCEFIKNRAVATGGSAQSWGGALFLPSAVSNCLFVGNAAATRGQSIASRTVTVRDCTFTGHEAGAPIISTDTGTTTLSRCILTNNAVQLSAAGVVIWNSLIAKNTLTGWSGARGIVDTRLNNCTVVDNAMGNGGSWNSVFIDKCVCINSVIVNDDVDFAMVGDSTYWVVMTNCVWSGTAVGQAWKGGAPTGENIVKVDKLADLKLSSDDPARPYDITRRSKVLLDKGTTAGLGYTAASLDFAKRPRVVKNGKTLAEDPTALPDIGCYECQEKAPGLMLLVR